MTQPVYKHNVLIYREFHKGNLAGLSHTDQLGFMSWEAALDWFKSVNANTSLDYTVVHMHCLNTNKWIRNDVR